MGLFGASVCRREICVGKRTRRDFIKRTRRAYFENFKDQLGLAEDEDKDEDEDEDVDKDQMDYDAGQMVKGGDGLGRMEEGMEEGSEGEGEREEGGNELLVVDEYDDGRAGEEQMQEGGNGLFGMDAYASSDEGEGEEKMEEGDGRW
ncbi:Oidioi.mRNA.OKI2018_I69.PAR.g11347.t1.cds [Oikopleura dioica]|uniref:Oidioi.mRNA.OKI2018_I69.PAR.g11347.t1.cds n=1 Tax=Oikopleura dioica TaxID=34765 RepID=A0ABN7RV95_OIKDI|nr:Oidioi.mRNA.OKI2018_I69.PAR.g11347.t1.cds [Oikopleura dioica]